MDGAGNRPLRECSKCKVDSVPEDGIEMGGSRWYCAGCWKRFFNRR